MKHQRTPHKISRFSLAVTAPLVLLTSLAWAAETAGKSSTVLTLDQYLSEVSQGNQGYRAARQTADGALLRSRESNLVFSPLLTATAQVYSDAKPQLTPVAPQKTEAQGIQLGISQQFPFGVQARLGYQLLHTDLDVSNPLFFSMTNYYDAIPSLELSVPLLRNFGGSEADSTRELADASAMATHYGESFRAKMSLFEAELSYWRLAVAREVALVQERTLDRNLHLQTWAEKRTQFNLGDRSDLLQANAAVRYRELELKAAKDEERAATQNFNSIRGETPLKPVGSLLPLHQAQMDIPATWKNAEEPPQRREDLLAAEQAERLTRGQSTQAYERNRTNLEIFGQASLNGRGTDASDAISRGLSLDRRTAAVGLRLVSSLNFGAKSDAQTGADKERDAASLAFDRKRFEQKQEFQDLKSKLVESQNRLALAKELEKIQEEKLSNERNRLQRGRSTTFQLIQFETDFSNAQLARVRSQFEVLRLVAQLHTFDTSKTGETP